MASQKAVLREAGYARESTAGRLLVAGIDSIGKALYREREDQDEISYDGAQPCFS